MNVIVKNYIRDFRKRLSWSQERLAELTGLSQNTVSELETGKHSCSLEHAFLISYAFGLDVEDVFKFDIIP